MLRRDGCHCSRGRMDTRSLTVAVRRLLRSGRTLVQCSTTVTSTSHELAYGSTRSAAGRCASSGQTYRTGVQHAQAQSCALVQHPPPRTRQLTFISSVSPHCVSTSALNCDVTVEV